MPAIQQSPTREQISECVYEIYQRRGGEPGHELEDWLLAEAELSDQAETNKKRGRSNLWENASPAVTRMTKRSK